MTTFQVIGFVVLILAVDIIVFLVFYRANRRLRSEMDGRLHAESELKDSKERLDLALLSSGIGTWDLSLANGRMIWDEGMHVLFGLKPGEFEGTRDAFRARIAREDLPILERVTLAAMENRAPFETEFRIIRQDGKVLVLGTRGKVFRDENQCPTRMLGMCEDITEEREAGERIRKLSQAVEQSPAMVLITNLTGTLEYVNPRFSEITGFSREEAIGRNPRFLKGPHQTPEQTVQLWTSITSGHIWKGEFCNRKKSGEVFWVDASVSPVIDASGRPTHFLAVQEDITHRKEMEKALEAAKDAAEAATEAKSQFLANMSHEIRTPMNAIMGLSYLCQQTNLTQRQSEYLRKIHVAAENLLGIINDILDFSKAEAGKMTLEAIEFDLDEVLEQLSDLVTGRAQEKGLEIVFLTTPGVPARVLGDPLRLRQILINLTNNAVKYTPAGEILVTTEVAAHEGDKVYLRFTVTDSGIGMTPEQLKNLFQPFSQADGSITRRFGGTGLGLTIAKRFVELMGGEISVESVPDKGSSFRFTARLGIVKERQQLELTSDLRGLNVLVIDKSECTLKAFRTQLQALSFNVTTTTDFKEALEKIRIATGSRPFDLVMLDWKYPGVSGMDNIRQIRAAVDSSPGKGALPARDDPSGAAAAGAFSRDGRIRLIIVVPFGLELNAEMEMGLEPEVLLIKPFTSSTLFDTIVRLFHKDAPQSRKRSVPLTGLEALPGLRGGRILLVEDNEINQEFAAELLEQGGLKVQIAGNGLIALNFLAKETFDCVLMDVQMPEMDGYTATQAIRRQQQFQRLPIIAMTAGAMTGDREKALKAGMNDYVTKPIDPQKLFRKLIQWVRVTSSAQAPDAEIPSPDVAAAPEKDSVPSAVEASVLASVQAGVQACAPSSGPVLPGVPDIPGMDVAAGLARIGGNLQRFMSVLQKFHASQADAPERIRQALAGGRRDEARISAHSLAGVSGNMGATEVEEAARAVESAIIREDAPGCPGLLDTLEARLQKLLSGFPPAARPSLSNPVQPAGSALASGLTAPAPASAPAAGLCPTPDSKEISALLQTLAEQLRQGDSGARDTLDKLRRQFPAASGAEPSELAAAAPLIDRYDFDAALAKITPLAQRLSGGVSLSSQSEKR